MGGRSCWRPQAYSTKLARRYGGGRRVVRTPVAGTVDAIDSEHPPPRGIFVKYFTKTTG